MQAAQSPPAAIRNYLRAKTPERQTAEEAKIELKPVAPSRAARSGGPAVATGAEPPAKRRGRGQMPKVDLTGTLGAQPKAPSSSRPSSSVGKSSINKSQVPVGPKVKVPAQTFANPYQSMARDFASGMMADLAAATRTPSTVGGLAPGKVAARPKSSGRPGRRAAS